MVVDTMASEYGWAKDDILKKVYIDEVIYLQKQSRRRRAEHYLMLLAIVTNPHIDKKSERRRLWDVLANVDKDPAPETLDKAGFERFRQTIMGSSKGIVVK